MPTNNHLTILAGSGLSFRLPSVQILTDEICDESNDWYAATDDRFRYSADHNRSYDYDTVQRAVVLINAVRALVNEHYIQNLGRRATYEDIYSIIHHFEDWNPYHDPLSDPMSMVVLERIRKEILSALVPSGAEKWSLSQLALRLTSTFMMSSVQG